MMREAERGRAALAAASAAVELAALTGLLPEAKALYAVPDRQSLQVSKLGSPAPSLTRSWTDGGGLTMPGASTRAGASTGGVVSVLTVL